ncbi:MAG: hypothetical protein ACAH27_13130 [Xanthobacteraceae bacterium]
MQGSQKGSVRPLVLALPLVALLAGCSGGGIGGAGNAGPMGGGNADGQGALGSSMETTTVAPTSAPSTAPPPPTIAVASAPRTVNVVAGPSGAAPAFAAAAPVASPGTFDAADYDCPKVEVRGGAAAWQVTDKSDGALRYQSTLGVIARECKFEPPTLNMRVGISGRVLLGTKGGPGALTVPLRLAVVEEGPTPKPIWTKLYTVPVQIGEGEMQVEFNLVAEDVSVPLVSPRTLEKYIVYVGFDPQAGAVAEARRKPAPKPVAAKPAAPKPVAARPKPAAPPPAANAEAEPAPAPAAQRPPAAQQPPATAQTDPNTHWIGTAAPPSGGFMTPSQ